MCEYSVVHESSRNQWLLLPLSVPADNINVYSHSFPFLISICSNVCFHKDKIRDENHYVW